MKPTMKDIRDELKYCYGIDVVFSGKKNGVNMYRVFAKTFLVNGTEYTKEEIIKKWLL